MDFNNFITYDKKEILLLEMAKSNREIAQNTKIKQQETLEFKMEKNGKYFKFDESLILERGEWQMGVISLEVYNSVYNITSKNNTLTFLGGISEEDQKLIEEYIEMMGNEINIYTAETGPTGDILFDIYYLSDLDYGSRKYIIEGLKNQLGVIS